MGKLERFQNIVIHLFFIAFSLMFLVPLWLVVSVSISNEDAVQRLGYQLLPSKIDFSSYNMILKNPQQLIDAYTVTFFQSIAATVLGVFIMAACSYALSRKYFALRRVFVLFIFFTMLFGGGLIPSYILNTQYLHLGNSLWIYIFPFLASAFYIIIMRTFFMGLPDAVVESAKIDGAGEFRVFVQIILPLSKPVLATIGLFMLLDRWNDWFTAMIYIRDQKLFTLQYLLQKILMEIEFLKATMTMHIPGDMHANLQQMPSETLRFAMAVIAAGPLLLVFPFFQKYFSRGLTLGAVKG